MLCWSRVRPSAGLILWLIWAVTGSPAFSQAPDGDSKENATVSKKIEAAGTTFEIIRGYIDKEDYAKVQKETRYLLDLKLPPKYDPQVVEAIIRIADKLIDKHQYGVAHAVVDMALRELGNREDNEAKLLKTKAFIFKAEGKKEQALEYFNKARALESRSLERAREVEKNPGKQ